MMYYWIIAAIIIFIIELFLGTVYLLVLSGALLGASLAAWMFGNGVAMLIAAVLSLFGCVFVWYGKSSHHQVRVGLSDSDLDIGQTVIIESQMANGQWCVQYRGTVWEARYALTGSLKIGTTAKIVGKDGNLLIIQ